MNRLIVPCAALLLSFSLPAQTNLVLNGDFELPKLLGWTEGGYALGQAVDMFDTTGIGSSNCYNCRPGGQVTPAPYPPNWIEQNVTIIQGVEYLFTCDLANSRLISTSNADGGTVEVLVDGTSIAKHAFGSYTAGTTKRERLCVRFTPTSTGSKQLKITFQRTYLTSSTSPTPTVYIDNVSLVMNPFLPVVCPRGERKVGSTMNLEISGTPNAKYALFVSTSQLAVGIPVPGFSGAWWLGAPELTVVFGPSMDATGLAKLPIPIPSSPGLAGLPLYWQGIEAAQKVSIGEPARFGVY